MIIADDSDDLGDVAARDMAALDMAAEYSAGFIIEAHLEAFLAGNWKSINWGLWLQLCEAPDGKSGHQFVTPIGRIDFCASTR